MAEKRCYGCMGPMEGPVCGKCGWQSGRRNEPHQLQPGTLLRGQYEIGRVLGQGGFGITYLGWDRHLETAVCIKEYFPSHAVSRDCTVSDIVHCHTEQAAQSYHASKERFLREAKVLAQFRDIPEIVGIYNFFEENNTAYIVMEYIRGTDLAHYIQRKGGFLSAEETFRILKPIMEAMAAVHRGELVHRDIAPDNIMLHPRGGAKLLDFGAARMVENAGVDRGLNRSTEAIVKHGFAPMEQYQTRGNLGPWTDVYAMCATVYYCLTGQIPPEATSRMMGDAELDWNQVPGLTNQQRYALDKGMAIHARDRYASMDELMEGLFSVGGATQVLQPRQRIPNGPAAPAPAPQKKKKKGLVFGIIAAVLVLAAAAGVFVLKGMQPQPAPMETEAPHMEAPPAQAPTAAPIRNEECRILAVTGSANGVYGPDLFDALTLTGYDVEYTYTVLDTVEDQINWLMTEIESNPPDAILWEPMSAIPEESLFNIRRIVDAAGIPVVLTGWDPAYETGSCPNLEDSYRLCYAGADPRTIGRRLVQALEFTGLSKADVNSDGRIGYLFLGHNQAAGDCQKASQEIVNTLESIGMGANSLEEILAAPTEKGGHEAVSRAYGFYMGQMEVIFCMDEAAARGAVMALEELGIAIGQDVFIVTVGGDGLRDQVNSGTFAGGVKGSYELQYACINKALSDGLQGDFTERYYRPSCELVVTAAPAAMQQAPNGDYIARGIVSAEGLNYRAEPKTDARSLGQYSRGTVLNFLVIENGWGLTDDGWVVMSYVELEEENNGGEDGVIRGMVTVGELNVHTAPSMDSGTEGFIVYGTQVEILQVQEVGGRQWGLIDQGWVRGWILMAYVEIGGVR